MTRLNTLVAIDSDRWAVETYRANFPGVRVECAEVAGLVSQLPSADVLLGGPPCQPFSDGGENEGEHDTRDCIPDFIAAVAQVRPRMFLMENVRGLLKEKHWRYFCRALEQFAALDYRAEWRLLDAVSFGVPQFRERVWVWGIRSDVQARHCWPRPTHAWPPPEPCMFGAALLPGITVGEALGIDGWYDAQNETEHGPDEPCGTIQGTAQARGGKAGHYAIRRARGDTKQHRTLRPIDEPSTTVGSDDRRILIQSHAGPARTIDRPSPTLRSGGKGHDGCCLRIIGGGSNPHFAGEERTERDITDEPSTTIAAQHTHNALPEIQLYRWSDAVTKWRQKGELWIRRLSPLECLRLQSGPDDFRWPSGIRQTHAYRIVGNGWASRMGAIFAEALHAADPQSRSVIDLFCGGGLGAVGWSGKFWRYPETESEVA